MSLNFDHGNVEDKSFIFVPAETVYGGEEHTPKYLQGKEVMNPAFESIIFATMSTGINRITIDNYGDFWKRYVMTCRATKSEPYFTLEDTFRAIGLKTNASSLTDAAFKKHVYAILEREVNWIVSRAVAALDEKKEEKE